MIDSGNLLLSFHTCRRGAARLNLLTATERNPGASVSHLCRTYLSYLKLLRADLNPISIHPGPFKKKLPRQSFVPSLKQALLHLRLYLPFYKFLKHNTRMLHTACSSTVKCWAS